MVKPAGHREVSQMHPSSEPNPSSENWPQPGKGIKDGTLTITLTLSTQEFIDYLDQCGQCRYLEVSNITFGGDIVRLDRAVWELRRFCTLAQKPRQAMLRDGFSAPKVCLPGRYLEKIINDRKRPQEPLLWQNAFFGRRSRKMITLRKWWHAQNSPLFVNPHPR
jgi:hypothetical protein